MLVVGSHPMATMLEGADRIHISSSMRSKRQSRARFSSCSPSATRGHPSAPAIARRLTALSLVPGYHPEQLTIRDRWRIDHTQAVTAGWNGAPRGGTWHTSAYARTVQRPIFASNHSTRTGGWR
jgi:hypothetical protein